MDTIQKFISDNKFQLGYIMQEASRQWIEKDPIGALTVGDCKAVVDLYGSYGELIDKVELYEKVLQDIVSFSKYEGNQWYENAKRALED